MCALFLNRITHVTSRRVHVPGTPGVTGQWRGRGAGIARAWRGLLAIFGLGGAGVARACPVTPGHACWGVPVYLIYGRMGTCPGHAGTDRRDCPPGSKGGTVEPTWIPLSRKCTGCGLWAWIWSMPQGSMGDVPAGQMFDASSGSDREGPRVSVRNAENRGVST
eukprot:gene24318-biopygen13439